MQRTLIVVGTMILLAGIAWPWLSRLPVGHLPGDIVIERPGMRVYFPLTTMLVVSLFLSFVLWLLRR